MFSPSILKFSPLMKIKYLTYTKYSTENYFTPYLSETGTGFLLKYLTFVLQSMLFFHWSKFLHSAVKQLLTI